MLGRQCMKCQEGFLWAEWLWERLCLFFVCFFLFCFFNSPSGNCSTFLLGANDTYKTLGWGCPPGVCLWQGLALKVTLSLLPVWFQGWGRRVCGGGLCIFSEHQHCLNPQAEIFLGDFLVVQGLWLCTSDAGGPGSFCGQEMRSRLPQLKILPAAMRIEDPGGTIIPSQIN